MFCSSIKEQSHMKSKYQQTELFVVCNIFGTVNAIFEIYTGILQAAIAADKNNELHEDANTRYEVIDLYNYLDCVATSMSVLDAYNNYHKD